MSTKTLNDRELAAYAAKSNPVLTLGDCQEAVWLVGHYLAKALSEGQAVKIKDLGTFTPYSGKPRKGRSILNPEVTITIPPRKRIRFKPNRELTPTLV